MRYRKIGKHVKGCASVEGVARGKWKRGWCLLGEKLIDHTHETHYLGNKTGHSVERGGEYWIVALCNDPKCKARIAVPENDILGLVPKI